MAMENVADNFLFTMHVIRGTWWCFTHLCYVLLYNRLIQSELSLTLCHRDHVAPSEGILNKRIPSGPDPSRLIT